MTGQTYSLYNVAGLIEKDKNIYYVPHQSVLYGKHTTTRTRVCDCFKALFDEVCPSSTLYTEVQITNWSPEDRTLRVVGSIDNFRVSRGQGLALNYCVMKRIVNQGEVGERTYYYSFFIDSVREIGKGTIELNMSVDHFTNFFYFNNEEECTEDYDPFNPVMRNCYVERQHYDRVEIYAGNNENIYVPVNEDIILNSEESFKYRYQFKDNRVPFVFDDIDIKKYIDTINALKNVRTKSAFVTFMNNLDSNMRKIIFKLFIKYLNIELKEDILLPITYGVYPWSEPPYKAYGYRGGLTSYNGVISPIINVIFPFISIPNSLTNIKPEWLFLKSLGNLNGKTLEKDYIVTPSEILTYFNERGLTQYILSAFISSYSSLENNLSVTVDNQYIIGTYSYNFNQNNSVTFYYGGGGYEGPLKNIEFNNVGIGILPPPYNVEDSKETFEGIAPSGNYEINCTSYGEAVNLFYTDNLLPTVHIAQDFRLDTYAQEGEQHRKLIGIYEGYDVLKYFGFIVPSNKYDRKTIQIDSTININLNRKYYETILESDPYTFYSFSINETEQPISKLRYYDYISSNKYSFDLDLIISYNSTYKIGLIPLFKLNGVTERYYSESLVSTINTEVPIIEDSWLTFYANNKSQMQSQYAVQQNSFKSAIIKDYTQSTIEGIGAVEGAYISGNMTDVLTQGAKAEAKRLSGVVGNIISNAYAKKNIAVQQSAKEADMGARPDTVRLAGSDVLYDLLQSEMGFYINHYSIDDISYSSIAKYLERTGYLVNIQDSLNPFNRIGLNYVKLISFDFVEDNIKISSEQAEYISDIFVRGVTLLHDKDYLHNLGEEGYHNNELTINPVTTQSLDKQINIDMLNGGFEILLRNIDKTLLTTNLSIDAKFRNRYGNNFIWRRRKKDTLEIIEEMRIGRIAITGNTALEQGAIEVYLWTSGHSYTKIHNPILTPEEYNDLNEYWTIELDSNHTAESSKPDFTDVLLKRFKAIILKGGDN